MHIIEVSGMIYTQEFSVARVTTRKVFSKIYTWEAVCDISQWELKLSIGILKLRLHMRFIWKCK